jgi:hypothetical protein
MSWSTTALSRRLNRWIAMLILLDISGGIGAAGISEAVGMAGLGGRIPPAAEGQQLYHG